MTVHPFIKGLFVTCFVLIQFSARAQSIKEYVTLNTLPIQTIAPEDTVYTDLLPIGEAIGNRRIVLLGEQDHGDAPTFLAKTRLIQFLHQKLGFDVIAFESDFYGLTSGFQQFEAGRLTIQQVMKGNIFPIWTQCDACVPLFSYIEQTQRTSTPLLVTGFDNQLHGVQRRNEYKNDILQLAKSAGLDSLTQQLIPILANVQSYYPLSRNQHMPTDTLRSYSAIMDRVVAATQHLPDSSYLKILLQSLRSNIYQGKYHNENSYEMMTVRDEQMAANLKWLLDHKFPGKKVIVWAHNYHIGKNTISAMAPRSGKHTSMGHVLAKNFAQDMYVLGFTSYNGKAGRIYVPTFNVPRPKKSSLEEWMKAKGYTYSFIDFSRWKPEKREFFFMKGNFHKNEEARWNEVFDGVFYINTMYPCKKIE